MLTCYFCCRRFELLCCRSPQKTRSPPGPCVAGGCAPRTPGAVRPRCSSPCAAPCTHRPHPRTVPACLRGREPAAAHTAAATAWCRRRLCSAPLARCVDRGACTALRVCALISCGPCTCFKFRRVIGACWTAIRKALDSALSAVSELSSSLIHKSICDRARRWAHL